jgi:nucleotide-binding universal stress UspA family protein
VFELGTPAELILARQAEHDLILLGTHGHTGFSGALLGGVSHAVLRSSRLPVLVLRMARATYLVP